VSSLEGNTISIGNLHHWCKANELTEQSADTTVGVLCGWRVHGPEDLLDEAAHVNFVITTKGLLQNAMKQAAGPLVSFVDIDQTLTYKILQNNYSMTVVGTSNTLILTNIKI
jgi:hypothetical protein